MICLSLSIISEIDIALFQRFLLLNLLYSVMTGRVLFLSYFSREGIPLVPGPHSTFLEDELSSTFKGIFLGGGDPPRPPPLTDDRL